MVTAHEADLLSMRNFLEEITKKKYNQGGLTLKDLKPDTFESNEKSKLSFRQWSDEFSLWVERIDQDFETLLRLTAQMQEWTKTSLLLRPNESIVWELKKVVEFTNTLLCNEETYSRRRSEKVGSFYGRNVQGATAIASQLQKLIFPLAERDQEVAIVKAAFMRVVPETYRRAMETQVDVDKVEPHSLQDKVLAFIRNNTSSAAPMDIGNIALGQTPTPGLGSSSQSATSSSHGGSTVIQT